MAVTELLTAEKLAELLQVQPGTIRLWHRQKLIPSVKLSPKVVRFELNPVVEALTQRQRDKERRDEMITDKEKLLVDMAVRDHEQDEPIDEVSGGVQAHEAHDDLP